VIPIALDELSKILQELHHMKSRYGDVDEKLRGWYWYQPPVEPPLKSVKLSVSEISNRYCPTMRDVYLRHVEGIKVKPTRAMIEGRIYHDIIKELSLIAKRELYYRGPIPGHELLSLLMERSDKCIESIIGRYLNGGNAEDVFIKARNLWRFLSLQLSSRVDTVLSKYSERIHIDTLVLSSMPPAVERIVDGSRVGLSSRLMVDSLELSNILVDFKTGRKEWFHRICLAGYALAMESDSMLPVDYGLLVYIRLNESGTTPRIYVRPYLINDEIRREFIELRDKAFAIVHTERDPGIAHSCSPSCPYYSICRG